MPVVRAEPPVMAAEVAGSVSERALLDALFVGNAKLADQEEAHMSPPLPTIGGTEGVAEAIAALGNADALLVQEEGRPVGVLTRADLLTYIAAFR
jgi:cystathionine beta-synthase